MVVWQPGRIWHGSMAIIGPFHFCGPDSFLCIVQNESTAETRTRTEPKTDSAMIWKKTLLRMGMRLIPNSDSHTHHTTPCSLQTCNLPLYFVHISNLYRLSVHTSIIKNSLSHTHTLPCHMPTHFLIVCEISELSRISSFKSDML